MTNMSVEGGPHQQYSEETLVQLAEEQRRLRSLIESKSRIVNEYLTKTAGTDSEPFIELLPQYQRLYVRIKKVVVVGPPAATFQVRLGDHNWPGLVLPATGYMEMTPEVLELGPQHRRLLTPTAAGMFSFELYGYADVSE